jgi:hypothetical protein
VETPLSLKQSKVGWVTAAGAFTAREVPRHGETGAGRAARFFSSKLDRDRVDELRENRLSVVCVFLYSPQIRGVPSRADERRCGEMTTYNTEQRGTGIRSWSRGRWALVAILVIAIIAVAIVLMTYTGGGSGGGGGGGY